MFWNLGKIVSFHLKAALLFVKYVKSALNSGCLSLKYERMKISKIIILNNIPTGKVNVCQTFMQDIDPSKYRPLEKLKIVIFSSIRFSQKCTDK